MKTSLWIRLLIMMSVVVTLTVAGIPAARAVETPPRKLPKIQESSFIHLEVFFRTEKMTSKITSVLGVINPYRTIAPDAHIFYYPDYSQTSERRNAAFSRSEFEALLSFLSTTQFLALSHKEPNRSAANELPKGPFTVRLYLRVKKGVDVYTFAPNGETSQMPRGAAIGAYFQNLTATKFPTP